MKKIFTIAIATVALLMGACQQNKPQGKPGDQGKVLPPLHLGAVHQVYPEQGFALLRIIGPMPKGGTVLITHPADGSNTRVGNLVVTSDQPARNNIIAADIRSGSVVKGDRVFMYRNIAAPDEKPEENTDSTTTTTTTSTTTTGDTTPAATPRPTTTEPEEEDTPAESTTTETSPRGPVIRDRKDHKTPAHIYEIPDDINDWN